jgi:hypothetical protein
MTDNLATKLSVADVQAMFDRSPFIGWLGLRMVSLDHERIDRGQDADAV